MVRVAYKHGTDKGNARKRQHDRTPKTRQDKTWYRVRVTYTKRKNKGNTRKTQHDRTPKTRQDKRRQGLR